MTPIIVFLAIFGAVDDLSFSGARLTLVNHPILVRMRWMIIGAATAGILVGPEWSLESPWSWAVLAVFLLTMIKRKRVT